MTQPCTFAADSHDVQLQLHTLGLNTHDMVVRTATQVMLCTLTHMTKIVTVISLGTFLNGVEMVLNLSSFLIRSQYNTYYVAHSHACVELHT